MNKMVFIQYNKLDEQTDKIREIVWNKGTKTKKQSLLFANDHIRIEFDTKYQYLTSEIYTDGNGNYTPNGVFVFAENAIDIKAASTNPSNPLKITNNHMWGFRQSDKSSGYCDDSGAAIATHFNTPNTIIENNVIFDSSGGIGSGDSRNYSYAMEDSRISNNLIYDVGAIQGTYKSSYALSITETINTTVENNTIINPRSSSGGMSAPKKYFSRFVYTVNTDFINNDIVLNDNLLETRSVTGGDTTTGNNYFNSITNIYTKDYRFTTDRYSNNLRNIELKNAIKP